MVTGALNVRLNFNEGNFDEDLTDERVKDMVQDTVLGHPELVYDSIKVVNDPSPENGLGHEPLNQLEEIEPDERDLCSLDIGDIFSIDEDGELYILVDVEVLGEHRDNVWSYVNAATGEFEGLLRDGACPEHFAETVHYYTHHNALGDE